MSFKQRKSGSKRGPLWRVATALGSAVALTIGMAALAPAANATGGAEPTAPYDHFCHHNQGNNNDDWSFKSTDNNGINGHEDHRNGEIIPPGISSKYPQGVNWNSNTWAIWKKCAIPAPEPDPTTYTVTLFKDWRNADNVDAATVLNVGGKTTSVLAGNDGSVSNQFVAGAEVSISETSLEDFDAELTCTTNVPRFASARRGAFVQTTGGDGLPSGATETSASFTMPSADVNCTFTNTYKPAPQEPTLYTVTVKKAWEGTKDGDNPSTYIWVKNPLKAKKTSANSGVQVSASYEEGSLVAFGETGKWGFIPSWSCAPTTADGDWSATGNGLIGYIYRMPAFDVTCTITNTKKHREEPQEPEDTVTVYKEWYLDGSETPADPAEGSAHPAGYDASFIVTVDGVGREPSDAWGQTISIPAVSESIDVGETGVKLADEKNCTYTSEVVSGSGEENFRNSTFNGKSQHQDGADYVFTIRNYVKCDKPGGDNGGGSNIPTPTELSPGYTAECAVVDGADQVTVTPTVVTGIGYEVTGNGTAAVTVVASLTGSNTVWLAPEGWDNADGALRTVVTSEGLDCAETEVAGVSQEVTSKPTKPTVQVKGESQVEAAPSATAKTGETSSYGWAGLALAAGLLLLLGAARLRRENEAG